MRKKILGCFLLFINSVLYANTLHIVAAENFYGEIAKQIGGDQVEVTSILNNPNEDPHLFSSSPSTAKALAEADLVIANGINYDDWINKLLQAYAKQPEQIIVAELLGKKAGDNPHIWYNPTTMFVYAKQLAKSLSQLDPDHKNYYQAQLVVFSKQYNVLTKNIAHLKQQYSGTPVIATEPVFNDMADALGLKMYGNDFQISIMNEAEPSVTATRDFEDKLRQHVVKVLFYNNQVTNPVTDRMKNLAKEQHITVVGVSETQPPGKNYWQWMEHDLNELDKALQASSI